MLTDLHHACRAFARRPGFAAAVVLTLTLVIAAAVAIGSVGRGLLLRPLPFPDGDRIVAIEAIAGGETGKLASREMRDIARDTRAFSAVAAFYPSQYNVTGDGPPESLVTMIGTSTLFDAFGVRMQHGDAWPRTLDFQTQYTVVLGHGLWTRRYGGDPSVVGRSIVLDGASYTVAGVLPPGFDYPIRADLYRAVTDYTAPDARRFSVVARLAPGVSVAEAQVELDGFAATFAERHPDTNRGLRFSARPVRDVFVGPAWPYVLLLAAAVLVVTLIACANIGNLLLARALAHRADLAVRTALGARRGHLVRLVLAEALVLAFAGGACGYVLGRWTVGAGMALVRFDLPTWVDVSPDAATALIAVAMALVVAAAVSLPPALHAARADLRDVAGTAVRAAGSRRQHRVLAALVASQVAFAVVVLAGAGVMARTMAAITTVDPGFATRQAVTFRVDPPWTGYGSTEAVAEFYRRAFERLEALPGVTGAASNMTLPFGGLPDVTRTVVVEGQATSLSADEQPFVNFQAVSANYFGVMGIPILAGRGFTEQDRADTPPVAVVSRRTADRFWPGRDPVGQRLTTTWRTSGTGSAVDREVQLTVIGVAGDVRSRLLTEPPALDLYASHHQTFAGDTFIVVATAGDPRSLVGSVGAAVREVDPEQSVFDVRTLDARLQATVWQQRTTAAVLGAFALVALVLAAVGVYAVLAYSVAQQTRELGVRRALGASDADLRRLVLRQGIGPVVAGLALGGAAWMAVAHLLSGFVYGIPVWDPWSLLAAPLAIAVVACGACLVPVRRALSVAPVAALRVGVSRRMRHMTRAGFHALALAASLLVLAAPGLAQPLVDGALLSDEPCPASATSYDDYVAFLATHPVGDPRDTPFEEATFRRNHPREWFEALNDGRRVRCRRITYASDGLRVTGFIVEPADAGADAGRPLIVFNRGGNRALGAIRTADLMEFAGWALDGYVVAASQYRGNDGGEGREEFGGSDVADVLNLLALARRLPSVEPGRAYMYGLSRGGMMTYLALKHGARVRAAAVVGGPGDLAEGLRHRPEMETVYRELMPDYASRRDAHLDARSAAAWPEALSAPLLILHGGADWRVWPGEALAVASGLQRLGRPYDLVIYAGDDHPLTANLPDVRARLRAWFARHR